MSSDPNKPDFVIAWTEPASAANTEYPPVYPFNHVTQTPGGHMIELDDTPGQKRVRIQHGGPDESTQSATAYKNGSVGSFVEWHPNGDTVYKVVGDGYEIILQDKNMLVSGKLNITVEGDANFWVKGDKIERIDGNYELEVKGNFSTIVSGLSNHTSVGDMKIQAGGAATGSIDLTATSHVAVNSDLSVTRNVGATTVTANRVDAVYGMSAGINGFVTVLGGIAVGQPIAIPLSINATGPINSLTSMSAPLGNFITMDAVLMTDVINSGIFDAHFHIASGSPTTPPTIPFT